MGQSPTVSSLKWLRKLGYVAEVVEHHIPFPPPWGTKRDLFGCIDLLALRDSETLAVQTTSSANLSSRLRKVRESPMLPVMKAAGWRVELHGWKKVGARWVPRIEEL